MADSHSLTGKVVLVTGGGRGLGAAVARHLAGLGAQVFAGVRRNVGPAGGPKAGAVIELELDVDDEAAVLRAFDAIDRSSGRLDVMVNNAGLAIWKSVETLTAADWQRTLSTNVVGAFLCAREAFRRMAVAGGGRIVHIGSIAATHAFVHNSAYAASKAALESLSASLNAEGAPVNVRSTLLRLGATATELTAQLGSPADMLNADQVAALIGDLVAQPLHVRIDLCTVGLPKGVL